MAAYSGVCLPWLDAFPGDEAPETVGHVSLRSNVRRVFVDRLLAAVAALRAPDAQPDHDGLAAVRRVVDHPAVLAVTVQHEIGKQAALRKPRLRSLGFNNDRLHVFHDMSRANPWQVQKVPHAALTIPKDSHDRRHRLRRVESFQLDSDIRRHGGLVPDVDGPDVAFGSILVEEA